MLVVTLIIIQQVYSIFLSISIAIHTIAHYYNYERFVAFNPPASVTKFDLPNGSFVPDESTVVVPESAVSYYVRMCSTIISCECLKKHSPLYGRNIWRGGKIWYHLGFSIS